MVENGVKPAVFTDLLRPDLSDYCPASNLAFNEKVKQSMAEGRTVFHFAFGQGPFPIPLHFQQALAEHIGEKEYLPVSGIPQLRKAICDFHVRYDQLTFDPDQVTVGPGTKELIFLLMNVFDGDVVVLSPCWTTYKPQSILAHHQPHVIPTTQEGEWRLTPALLEQAVVEKGIKKKKLLIFCNPDNPTGTTYSEEHLRALSVTLRKHNFVVLSDEIYGRINFAHAHHSIAKYYPEGTILSSGMSKWANAGGWRVGAFLFISVMRKNFT